MIDGVIIALGQYKHADGDELYERIPWVGYTYIIVMGLIILLSLIYIAISMAAVAAIIHGAAGAAAGSAAVTPTP